MSPESNNKIVLTRGLNGCLMLYPLDEWERVKIGLMKYNVFDEEERSFMRQFMMYVHECDLDSHNRFLLPSQLIEFAHIKKDVLLLGMLQNIEIFSFRGSSRGTRLLASIMSGCIPEELRVRTAYCVGFVFISRR